MDVARFASQPGSQPCGRYLLAPLRQHQLSSSPTFLIPHWTIHTDILYQVCVFAVRQRSFIFGGIDVQGSVDQGWAVD